MLIALQAILLGVIEGFTEFLPISSTGHLIIAEKYMSFHDDAKIFTVVIQVGAIAAVIWYYRADLRDKIRGFIKADRLSQTFVLNVVIATIPAGLLGLALNKHLEKIATPKVVAAALIIGGIILWLVENYRKPTRHEDKLDMDQITMRQALGIGMAQAVSLIPGVSRAGASIVGGLVGGLNRMTATTFSFYIGLPLLIMASGYKLISDRHELGTISGGSSSIILGSIASFVVGLLAVSWLLKYVSSHNYKPFAYYRIVLGIFVLLLAR